jgi:hypothetical protein
VNPNTLACSWRGDVLEMEAWDCPRCKVTACNHPEIAKPTTANKWRRDQSKLASCIRCPLRDGPNKIVETVSTGNAGVPTCKASGPGTELRTLLQEAGISAAWCEGCKGHAKAMDQWGVEGCERHRAEIVGWLRESANKVGWLVKLQFGWSLSQHPWFDPLDPFNSIFNEAILRAKREVIAAPWSETIG